jgi:steroid 5-alpha reductase family enzyme
MERHLLAGHPNYQEYQQRVSPFFPWVSSGNPDALMNIPNQDR